MKLLRISLAGLAAGAALAAPAHAATGNGLYEPFPSPTSETRAQEFVHSLPGGAGFTDLSSPQLERGLLVGKPAVTAYATGRGPAERARAGAGFAPSIGWAPALVLLAAVVAGAGLLVTRRA